MPKSYDLTGQTINGWQVLELVPNEVGYKGLKVYRCRCTCGEIVWLNTQQIRNPNYKRNCGNPKKHPDLKQKTIAKANRMGKVAHMKQQLCWTCRNACGKCPWSDKDGAKPVPGWKAKPKKVYISNGKYQDSYLISECPLYAPG